MENCQLPSKCTLIFKWKLRQPYQRNHQIPLTKKLKYQHQLKSRYMHWLSLLRLAYVKLLLSDCLMLCNKNNSETSNLCKSLRLRYSITRTWLISFLILLTISINGCCWSLTPNFHEKLILFYHTFAQKDLFV